MASTLHRAACSPAPPRSSLLPRQHLGGPHAVGIRRRRCGALALRARCVAERIKEAEAPSEKILEAEVESNGIREISITSNVREEEAVRTGKDEQSLTRVRHNIVFVTSEAAPYSKTGGLGDVCGSLPIALAARGHRVMVVSPRYLNGVSNKNYANAVDLDRRININCFGGPQEVAFFHEYSWR